MLKYLGIAGPTIISPFKNYFDGGNLLVPLPAFPITVYFYFDAGGYCQEKRTWGGLAVIGDDNNTSVKSIVGDIRSRNKNNLEPNGEIKGGVLTDCEIEYALSLIRNKPIFYWGREYDSFNSPAMTQASKAFLQFVDRLQPNEKCKNFDGINKYQFDALYYLDGLKHANLHKFLSIIAHTQALVDKLYSLDIPNRMCELQIFIDKENFPESDLYARYLKGFMASFIQSVGMCNKLTGNAFFEKPNEGAVKVYVECDSSCIPGLEYVDILIQGTWRKLSAFKAATE